MPTSGMVACPAADSGGLLAPRRGVRSEPDVGEQLVELLCGMGREATEDVGEVGEGIDVVVLTRPGEGIQHGRRPSAAVTAEECPVAASESLSTEHPLGEVVVDAQLPVLGVATER